MKDSGLNHNKILKNETTKPMKVSLDDNFRIFFVGPTVVGYDFTSGEQLGDYNNGTYLKTGSSGAISRDTEAPW